MLRKALRMCLGDAESQESWPLPRRGFPDLITKAAAFVVVVVEACATMGMSATAHVQGSTVVPGLMMSDLKPRRHRPTMTEETLRKGVVFLV